MKIEQLEKYLEIMLVKFDKGLEILEKDMTVADEGFKDVVVNLNNINNIVMQINKEIEEVNAEAAKREEIENRDTAAEVNNPSPVEVDVPEEAVAE